MNDKMTQDELMERYFKLANTQEIPNIARYAFEWSVLAEDAIKAGRLNSGKAWKSRAEHYAKEAGGEYIRLIEGSFSELICVDPEWKRWPDNQTTQPDKYQYMADGNALYYLEQLPYEAGQVVEVTSAEIEAAELGKYPEVMK